MLRCVFIHIKSRNNLTEAALILQSQESRFYGVPPANLPQSHDYILPEHRSTTSSAPLLQNPTTHAHASQVTTSTTFNDTSHGTGSALGEDSGVLDFLLVRLSHRVRHHLQPFQRARYQHLFLSSVFPTLQMPGPTKSVSETTHDEHSYDDDVILYT